MNVNFFLITIIFVTLSSCSIPDLNDEDVLKTAKEEAIEISTLTKEFMYGMMWLYVDDDNETYTGWVKDTHPNKNLKSLGYLKNGQKQGLWISWHKNGRINTKSGWNRDYHQGVFECWHPNGKKSVIGQTYDGEMNGEWKAFYNDGKKYYLSFHDLGKVISKTVWKKNGQLCEETNMVDGNGIVVEYDGNGNEVKKITYENGKRIKELVP